MVRTSRGTIRHTEHHSSACSFDYIVASLAPELAIETRDLLLSPPEDHSYDTLKSQLIQWTAASEQCRLQQLLTTLLCWMQQLLGDSTGPNSASSFLRELFLQRLPSHVCMVLASSGEMPLEQLAQLADKIVEVATPSVSAINIDPLTSEVEQLRAEVIRLQSVISTLQITSQPRPTRSKSCSRPRRGTTPHFASPVPPASTSPEEGLCWYHRKYGDQAHKCTSLCTWSGNAPASC